MPIKAKKEITVYKVFIGREKDRMVTPFYRTPAFLHNELKATGKMDFEPFDEAQVTEVNGGFIHCYTNKQYIDMLIKGGYFDFLVNENLVVAQCTIKPGTLYFKSVDTYKTSWGESVLNEICARSIFIDKIVSYYLTLFV